MNVVMEWKEMQPDRVYTIGLCACTSLVQY